MKDFDTFGTLKWLAEVKGVSGNEQGAGSAAEVALELLREYIPDAGLDCHGSVVGFIGERENDKPTIMLDAHIDQIGLIVTHIDSKGFIKVEPCGGIDRRTLAAQAVTIHSTRSKSPIKATVCTLPPHVKKNDGEVLKADSIMLDAGMTAEQSKELISLGDVVTIDGEPILLQGKIVTAGALDDRAGVCSILYALHLLKESDLEYNIAVSFSVQEELGCRGATVTAYNAEPEFAVVVDVSYGLSPGCFEPKTAYKCGVLGKGPMIGYAPSLNREMFERLKAIAAKNELPYQVEIMSGDTGGTNADSITIVKGGIKTALVSIPLRYMHTPVETVDLSDIESAGKLLAEFIKNRGERND